MARLARSASDDRIEIPCLTEEDVIAALGAAKKKLNAAGRATMREKLSDALRNYVVERLLVEAKRVSPSQLATKLKHFAGCTRGLAEGLETPPVTVIPNAVRNAVLRHSLRYADRLRAILGPSATINDSDAPLHAAQILLQLAQVFHDATTDALDAARRRTIRNAKRINPGKAREPRRATDRAMIDFFGTLNGLWLDLFYEIPGATLNAYASRTDRVGGPYIAFAESILHSYAGRIPDAINTLAPGLRAKLRLSRAAIHARFRQTGFSDLRRRIAKSVLRLG
jgi:hypothetical protein